MHLIDLLGLCFNKPSMALNRILNKRVCHNNLGWHFRFKIQRNEFILFYYVALSLYLFSINRNFSGFNRNIGGRFPIVASRKI